MTGVGNSALPADTAAVVLNVTGTEATTDGYVTAWPCGSPRPLASNLNLVAGSTAPNLVIVRVGDGGEVCLFTQSGTHLIADLAGYFPADSSFTSLVPERLLDTRPTSIIGYAGSKPTAGDVLKVQVTGVGASSIPPGASAEVLNVTATAPDGDGYVTVWPCGSPRPTASNLNFVRGQTVPNLAVVGVGSNGTVCLYTMSPVDLVADVAGYFIP